MDPWRDATAKGCQLSCPLIAFGGANGSASVWRQHRKLFYPPEAHTDFLLAVIAEELGFAGVVAVVVMFAILIQRAFAIGKQAL